MLMRIQISTTIGSNFGPRVNRLAVEGKDEEIAELFIKISEIQLIILFLMVGGFASCGKDFIFAWLGGKQ
jgi:O-antigen/teichoic acid export membrane protein